jgi:hypothetical protein
MNFRYHTRGQAFGIGSSVMASPLLEISPKPNWAQHSAHRTRSGAVTDLSGDNPSRDWSNDVLEATEARFRERTSASCA